MTQIRRGGADPATARAGTAVGTAAGSSSQAVNALGVLPVAPRFSYLPISVPGLGGLASTKSRASLKSMPKLPTCKCGTRFHFISPWFLCVPLRCHHHNMRAHSLTSASHERSSLPRIVNRIIVLYVCIQLLTRHAVGSILAFME